MTPPFRGESPKSFAGRRVRKPWGSEWIWAETARYAGKILYLRAGQALSWQFHRKKDETLCLLSGAIEVETAIQDDGRRRKVRLKPGKSLNVPRLLRHRIIALEDSAVLEASSPELDDVVRLADLYGRADKR